MLMRLSATRVNFPRLLLVVLCAVPAFIASVNAQVAGRNVNMVSGGVFPGGDPFRQKQNEPSIAVSTRNSCHLLAGANDYRAVELAGLPDDQEIGDAWLGWYESTDCGATWYSTLVPGYPQDQSPEGLASPVKGLGAGADPVVRSGAAGTFYYLFIAFNRGSNVGKLALARAIDHNDRDAFVDPNKLPITDFGRNNPRRALSPIEYLGTTEIAHGSGGRFIDKPSLTVFPGSGTCTIAGEAAPVPATNVYVAWTEFVGNNPENQRSKVYFARSTNCGQTLAGPATKLSEGYPLGQGTVIGVNPNNPNDIYVMWRQIRNDRARDALLFARSSDGGRSFTKAEYVPGFAEGEFAPFDQNTTSTAIGSSTTTFRTVAYPALAFADDGYLYMAVSQVPGGPSGTLGGVQARITMTRTKDGVWEAPREVASIGADGQQFMPALAYAAGKLQLIWYDVRFDEAEPRRSDSLIDEAKALTTSPKIRRTIDLMGAQASLPSSVWPPAFQPYGVAQPDYNEISNGVRPLRGPRISQYRIGDRVPGNDEAGPRQLQFNRANLPLYGGGTIPFIGDYIDISGTPFVFDGAAQRWVLNGLGNKDDASMASFHAAWTDNRDAGVGKATTTPSGALDYTRPVPLPENVTITDAVCPVVGGKEVDNTGTRDANVYTSRITNEFSLTLPINAKPTNTPGVVRAFPVQLANNLELTPGVADPETPTRFKLTVDSPGASFSYKTFRGAPHAAAGGSGCDVAPGQTPVNEIFVNVLPRSSAARTVHVRCGTVGRIVVTATRMILVDNPDPQPDEYIDGPSASVTINPDPSNPATKGPDGSPLGPESHNPDAENPDAENPDAENPDAENPDAENPDAENPDAENPDAENPDAENPDAENPDAENPDAENPDAENPDAENTNYQDVSVDVSNDGDTTSSYQVQVQSTESTGGYTFLLMGRRVTTSPTSINCHIATKYTNQTLFAIPLTGAQLSSGEFAPENTEDVTHPTFLVRPGESIRVTLRVVSKVSTPEFCSTNPLSPQYCFNKLVFKTRAQAPNTGELEPREDIVGNIADLVIDPPFSVAPAAAGVGGFVDSPAGATIRNAGTRGTTDFNWSTFITSPATGNVHSEFIGGTGGLAGGNTIPTGPVRVRIPTNVPGIEGPGGPLPPGTYQVGLRVDTGNAVRESNEANNTLMADSPITVFDYTASIQEIDDPSQGSPFQVDVNVRGPGRQALQGATVTLSLEGPITDATEPGPPSDALVPPVPTAQTNADGNATFNVTIGSGGGSQFRIIATVQTVGVPELKFQSLPFTLGAPEPLNLVVINTNDSGPGSLRQAIADANATPGLDQITFNIPGSGAELEKFSITPLTLLPLISDPVVIDATTQPGYDGAPVVVLDGINFVENTSAPGLGFLATASGSTIKGLGITSFGQSGIRLTATKDVVIQSNWIGFDPRTNTPAGSVHGVLLFGATNTSIGGPFSGDGNIGDGNIIGGHSFAGITMRASQQPTTPSSSNVIRGNIIGAWPDMGGAANGNGVVIQDQSSNNRIGADSEFQGANRIANNTDAGVRVDSGVNNAIQLNRIDGNGGLGIDLGTAGITPNDAGDADTGANDLQNWPVLRSAIVMDGVLRVEGALDSAPDTHYVIDVYITASCDGNGRQGNRFFAFGATVITDANGTANIEINVGDSPALVGEGVTVTATPAPNAETPLPLGGTSEFSNCQVVDTP